jgi:hypothetical protein
MASHVSGEAVMSFGEHSMAFAQELGRVYASLRNRSFDELEQALLKIEVDWTAAVTESEAREVRRRIAEELLMGAYTRDLAWPQFSRALERVRSLGYSNVERQVHVACLFARWAHRRREHEEDARSALDQAEQQIAQGGPSDPASHQMQASIDKTRDDTGYRPR